MQKILIIKVGSSLMVTARNRVDRKRIAQLIRQVGVLREAGWQPVLVVSGAVACGRGVFPHLTGTDQETRQMLAGAGQALLTTTIQAMALRQQVCVSQLLLTKEDVHDAVRRERLQRILMKTIHAGCIPVINENDAVALNSFGGNDLLAQEIASLVDAQSVVILTNVQGLLDLSATGRTLENAHLIEEVLHSHDVSPYLSSRCSTTGTGGMVTKVAAARRLQHAGIQTIIVSGHESEVLVRLFIKQEKIGTRFVAHNTDRYKLSLIT